ncbi:hypothetical protein H2204_009967 [Knufia peltigerae]|uniref:Major facilitator superfamily (MFS) profile domain-containing protein n=1 Tax=Knufia peltigerae TaxID=1002370 RepID=A0AA39CVE2_9EURO|nr:hypothetical protein H2204_009967 [Knufia peltigerae]
MKFRTLHELGHDEREVTLIDNPETVGEHHPHLRGTNVVLVPHPSSDVNDPLRMPSWKKWAAFINVCILTFMTTAWVGGITPSLFVLSVEFKVDVSRATGLLTWPVLAAGICNFFWTPTSEYLGRRPVFLVASVLLFACEIWAATSPNLDNLLASRVIGAFAGSCTESMGALIVNDIFYLHERGAKMGVYLLFITSGNSLGPLVAGFITEGIGWRWVSWICAIISGINCVGIFFLFPETRWHRNIDASATLGVGTLHESVEDKSITEDTVEHVTSISDATVGVKTTYMQELNPWSGTTQIGYVNHLIRPWPLLAYPAIALGALAYSTSLAWLVGAGSLSSFVFSIPPYSFGPGVSGLINVPGVLGILFGAFIGGKCTDWVARRAARRNHGKFTPESRLVLLVVPFVVGPCGLLMFGIGAQKRLHWIVLFIGYGMINVLPATASIAMTYVMDSYFEIAAEGLLVVNGVKNIVAFGFSYGFIPWSAKVGYTVVLGTMSGILMFVLMLYIPIYIWGAKIRRYTTSKMKIVLI